LSGNATGGAGGGARMTPIRCIAVAGEGPVAWIAAAALVRAFPSRPFEVTVIDTGANCDMRAGRWTLPSQRGIHALLGISEPHLVERSGATFKLATEHCGWQGANSRFFHAHGDIGVEFGPIPFYKFLLSETIAGRTERPEAFSVAGSAARFGKFARPMGDARTLTSSFTYGFHLEETAYTDYLRAHALKLGVHVGTAPLASVVRGGNGDIDALELVDGNRVAADLFIDASGPDARLIGELATERTTWNQWLPCDAMWSAHADPRAEPPPVTQTFASDAGWMWRAPLARSTLAGHVFSTQFVTADAALAALRAFEPALRDTPLLTRFVAGRRRFWVSNCVAIGASAVQLEPLAGADLHLAQLGIAMLIELFPRERASAVVAAEYERLMADYADRVRDFTLAHYHAGAPLAGAFWEATRAQPLPETLAARLELFSASGRINLLDHESFEETDWAWLLIGSGRKPASLEMQIRLQLAKLALPEVAALRTHIDKVAASMPSHAQFLRLQGASARASG
jgi:tryptophan halogenase